MAATLSKQNISSDKWLAGLVDAMEDISAADEICRAANPVAVNRLLEQLSNGAAARKSSNSKFLG